MMKVIEAFGGVGCQATALENLGVEFESTLIEIDENAARTYMALHGETPNLGDITKVEHLPECDLLTWSFPCCPAGTMVRTADGHVPIEDVREGDLVLTHRNRFMPVVRTMSRVSPGIYRIKAVGCELCLTDEHPLYVYRDGNFVWVKVKDLRFTDRLAYNVNQQDIPNLASLNILWMLGRYVADGHVDITKYHSVEFSIGDDKAEEFEEWSAKASLTMRTVKKKGCVEYRTANKRFQELCLEFGNGSTQKHIPGWVLALPKDDLKVFLDGYLSGDGHKRKDVPTIMFSTVSKELFMGLQECILKVYGVVCSLFIRHDGRKATFNDTYNGQFSPRDDTKKIHQVRVDDKMVVDIRSIERIDGNVAVYNLEVNEDNSYTADNVIVHNCQSMSIAGKQEGMKEGSGTTSSLGWEVIRLLRDAKARGVLPEYLVMENVYALTNKRNMPEFQKLQFALWDLGYSNSWRCLNAKDYRIPQNRKRIFMVSSLTHGEFIFPDPVPLTTRLKDFLEDEVDESYYLDPEVIEKYEAHKARHRAQGHGLGWEPQDPSEVSHTITTHPSKDSTNTIIIAGTLHTTNYDKMNRVYDPDGVSPTIETPSGGGKMPKIVEYPSGTAKGYMEAHAGDGLVMERPHKARGTVQPQSAPTLTTGKGCGTGVVVEAHKLPMNFSSLISYLDMICDYYDACKANAREVLPDLWQKDGKKENQWKIGGPGSIQKEKILLERVHEDGVSEIAETTEGQIECSYDGKDIYGADRSGKDLCRMWQHVECRCASQGWGLDEQSAGELSDALSQLSYEDPSSKKRLQDMWQTDGRWSGLLQQALSALQKIWRSFKEDGTGQNILLDMWEPNSSKRAMWEALSRVFEEGDGFTTLKVRYLSEREVWRLMGFNDEQIDKAFAVTPAKTQRYKQAGNGIVVQVLEAIFKGILDDTFVKKRTLEDFMEEER